MFSKIVSVLAAASVVSAQASTSAPVITGNPAGVSYVATLPEKAGSALRGSLSATSAVDGTGVNFKLSISGLPAEGGPFMYHIHELPVPENGNCTATKAHLDPYKRGEVPICDASKPETCQTGDLSGKHGNMTTQEWSQEYLDTYLALRADDVSFFGNLSFVVHLSNKTRIGCANFVKVEGDSYSAAPVPSASSGYAPYPSASAHHNTTVVPSAASSTTGAPIAPSSTSPASPEFTGAASKIAGGSAALLAAFAALML